MAKSENRVTRNPKSEMRGPKTLTARLTPRTAKRHRGRDRNNQLSLDAVLDAIATTSSSNKDLGIACEL